jgi:hypothetical protein
LPESRIRKQRSPGRLRRIIADRFAQQADIHLRTAGPTVMGNLPERIIRKADLGCCKRKQNFACPGATAQHTGERSFGQRIRSIESCQFFNGRVEVFEALSLPYFLA